MIIGLPKEIKDHEERIALLPDVIKKLNKLGHQVLVQQGAGQGSGYEDSDYRQAGAKLIKNADSIYARADLIIKVKEPLPPEYAKLRKRQLLFCYLHLAANLKLIEVLRKRGVRALGLETLLDAEGHTPLLSPMSEIAGRLSAQLGAQFLRTDSGGKGLLLSPTAQTAPGRVVVVGGGHVGRAAAEVAAGLGALVQVFDIKPKALQSWAKGHQGVVVKKSTEAALARAMKRADLVIGSVYVPGAKTPQVIRREMVRSMSPGSVLVDVAVDQGGASETTHATSITHPSYEKYGVIHSAIPNLPALVSRSASQALSKVLWPYVRKLASLTDPQQVLKQTSFRGAVNVWDFEVIHPKVKEIWQQFKKA